MRNLQSVLIRKKDFTLAQAHQFIKQNGYRDSFYGKPVEITPSLYRFRQEAPHHWRSYYIHHGTKGVMYVIGI